MLAQMPWKYPRQRKYPQRARERCLLQQTNTRILSQPKIILLREQRYFIQAQIKWQSSVSSTCYSSTWCHERKSRITYIAHRGTKRTQDQITLHYWWLGMRKAIKSYVRFCDLCQRRKAKVNRKSHQRNKDLRDRKIKARSFEVNDLVYSYTPITKPGLSGNSEKHGRHHAR